MIISKRHIKRAGIFEPPTKLLNNIFKWAREQFCAVALYKTERLLRLHTDEVEEFNEDTGKFENYKVDRSVENVELNLIRKKCLEYTNGPAAVKDETTRIFDVDFTDWKYIKDSKAPKNFSIMKKNILVSLYFLKAPIDRAGDWQDSSSTMRIFLVMKDITTLSGLEHRLRLLYQTIYHELQHMGQNYLQIKNTRKYKAITKEDPYPYEDPPKFQAGLPSQSIQNKVVWHDPKSVTSLPKDEQGELHHGLRDIEFYTDLNDEIETLKRLIIKYPKNIRMELVKSFINKNYTPKLQDKVPYLDREEIWRLTNTVSFHSNFFENLLKYEPGKYQKAVKELFKKIENEVELSYGDIDNVTMPLAPGKTKLFGNTVANYNHFRSIELLNELPTEEAKQIQNTYREHFFPKIIKEYDAFINALTPQQLSAHKQAVEASGNGMEYYVTDRWRVPDFNNVAEPERDKNRKTIVAPHPKLSKKGSMVELLIKLSNQLDNLSAHKEADNIDELIKTFSVFELV